MIPLSWKIGIGAAIGVAVLSAVALSYNHYSGLVESKVALTSENGLLKQAVVQEKARADAFERAIDKWDEAAATQVKAMEDFSTAQREAGTYQRELKDVLSKHDLGALARAKPGLVQSRINAGTADAFRLLEQSTQAPAAGAAQAAPSARPTRPRPRQD